MMAKIYYNRLLVGTITFDAIPERYQAQVIAYGKADVVKGKLTEEQFEMLFKIPYDEA